MLPKIHWVFNSLVEKAKGVSKINLALPPEGLSFSSCVPKSTGWQDSSLRSSPELSVRIYQGWVSGGWGQTLFSGVQWQDKGQRAQEVPAEHEEELLHSEGDGALEQAAQWGCGDLL